MSSLQIGSAFNPLPIMLKPPADRTVSARKARPETGGNTPGGVLNVWVGQFSNILVGQF
jgi:hypothetical protein